MAKPGKGEQGVPKAQLLRQLGFGGDMALADPVLEAAGLSNPRKERISESKTEAVREALKRSFIMVCNRGDCHATAAQMTRDGDARTTVAAASADACSVCGGSVNDRSVQEMISACHKRGWRRVCVIGGSPNARQELGTLVGRELDLRLVDGTVARTKKQARDDTDWSDCVVIWGSTQLAHKVSTLYSGTKVFTVAKRSVQELAREVARSAAM
ncbi:MAG: hypothetical protein AB7K09_14390 [Planctomycetota bacterium]